MPAPLTVPGRALPVDIVPASTTADPLAPVAFTGRRASIGFDDDTISVSLYSGDAAESRSARINLRVQGSERSRSQHALGIERRIDAGPLRITERSTAFHDLPLAVLEWQADGSVHDTDAVGLDTTIRLDPVDAEAAHVHWRTGAGSLLIRFAGVSVRMLSHEDARFAVRETTDRIHCSITLPLARSPVRLVVSAVIEGDDVAAILDAARDADGRILARAATLRRRDRECLVLESADPRADDVLRSAVRRLDTVSPARGRGPSNTLLDHPAGRLACAALAAGETDIGRDIITSIGPDPALAALFLAWTGHHTFLPDGTPDPGPPGLAGPPPPADRAAIRIVASDPMLADSISDPILGLVLDLLGVSPDAARGRIRFRPVMPDAWDQFEVRNLPLGDAKLRIRIARTRDRLEIEIEQTHGAMPVQAILEPVVSAHRIVGATVDDTPALLAPRPIDDRIQVPVQIALDHTRRVVLVLA